jgi:LmbE family N-acetylglucosaminyl deacetylase
MSTLHGRPGDLRTVRADELAGAARELGVARVELTGHPDGALHDIPMPRLAADVSRLIGELTPSHLLVFDMGGVTGHPDHRQATSAALLAARRAGVTVLGWTLPQDVTVRLNRRVRHVLHRAGPGRVPSRRTGAAPTPQRRAITFPQSRLRSTGRDPHRESVLRQPRALAPPELLRDREYLKALE